MKVTFALLTISAFLSIPALCWAQAGQGPPASRSAREKEKADAIDQARRSLARKLDVKGESLKLESAKEATWPDASLGCPEPDRMYAQVVTHGYSVVLGSGSKSYEVHVAGDHTVICDRRRSEPPDSRPSR